AQLTQKQLKNYIILNLNNIHENKPATFFANVAGFSYRSNYLRYIGTKNSFSTIVNLTKRES
ncbi:hypothetical protein EDM29_14820, partial [Staphylococcus aureus]